MPQRIELVEGPDHVVDSGAVVCDDPQLRSGAVQARAVDARRQQREDAVHALDAVDESEGVRERLVHARRDRAGHVHGRAHARRRA